MKIIDGKKIRDSILEGVKSGVENLSFSPVFCDILVGDDPVSLQYVRIKARTAESVGIKFREAIFKNDTTTEEIINAIENLNKVPYMCGIIVQLPLPSHIDKDRVLNSIDSRLDVDCLSSESSTNFYYNKSIHSFPTALACVHILDSLNLDFTIPNQDGVNKKIVILGNGMLVGRPVTHLLKQRGLDVETIDSKSSNKEELIKNADILISAIGRGNLITGSMIKDGAIVIDAGTSEEDGGVVGDVDTSSLDGVASIITPTPGGVGPVTVAMLLQNVLNSALNKG
jgi:methylenetetrahydrofolate dehydrogenase (NADP+)/methenyltetrahydrofolate cyclohydrolase